MSPAAWKERSGLDFASVNAGTPYDAVELSCTVAPPYTPLAVAVLNCVSPATAVTGPRTHLMMCLSSASATGSGLVIVKGIPFPSTHAHDVGISNFSVLVIFGSVKARFVSGTSPVFSIKNWKYSGVSSATVKYGDQGPNWVVLTRFNKEMEGETSVTTKVSLAVLPVPAVVADTLPVVFS